MYAATLLSAGASATTRVSGGSTDADVVLVTARIVFDVPELFDATLSDDVTELVVLEGDVIASVAVRCVVIGDVSDGFEGAVVPEDLPDEVDVGCEISARCCRSMKVSRSPSVNVRSAPCWAACSSSIRAGAFVMCSTVRVDPCRWRTTVSPGCSIRITLGTASLVVISNLPCGKSS